MLYAKIILKQIVAVLHELSEAIYLGECEVIVRAVGERELEY